MPYHKRPLQKRRCAHCNIKFEAAHKSRLYCCQSCNTLAWRARQTLGAVALAPTAAESSLGPPPTLGGMVMGSALGTLAAQTATYALQQFTQGGSSIELLQAEMRAELRQLRHDLGLAPTAPPPVGLPAPASPAPFLPPALASATTPVEHLDVGGETPQAFVRLHYHGHVLYHQPGRQLVLWAYAPGRYRRILAADGLALLASYPVSPAAGGVAPEPAPVAETLLPEGQPTPLAAEAALAADQAFEAALAALAEAQPVLASQAERPGSPT